MAEGVRYSSDIYTALRTTDSQRNVASSIVFTLLFLWNARDLPHIPVETRKFIDSFSNCRRMAGIFEVGLGLTEAQRIDAR